MTGLAIAAKATDIWVKCGGSEEKPGFWYTLDAGKKWVNVTVSPLESGKIAYGGYVAVSADGKRFSGHPETTAASTIPTIRARPGQRAMVE